MKSILSNENWHYSSNSYLEGQEQYAQIPMSLMNRSDISARAKAIFAYMTSKPSYYQFASKRIAMHFKEGYRAILASISELEHTGYILKQKQADGRMFYTIKEDYWSLTPTECKEALLHAFSDAFRRTAVIHDPVTLEQAKDAIMPLVGNSERKAFQLAIDLAEQCRNAGLSMNEKTLSSWVNHIKLGSLM